MSDPGRFRGAVPAVTVTLALVLQALLAMGGLLPLPDSSRIGLSFVLLVLLPGAAWLRLLRANVPGGGWLAPGWALGCGVAWNAILVLIADLAGLPFLALSTWSIATTAILWLFVSWRRGGEPAPESIRLSGAALATVLIAAAIAAWHAGWLGTYITYYSDSPDHIGTIRRMLLSGDPFPVDAFFKYAGEAGADPRKGLWHPQVALIARLSTADPYVVWRDLSTLLSPLYVLNAATLGVLLFGRVGGAVAACALLFTYGGSLGGQAIRETVYATKLADQLSLATAVAVFVDLRQRTRGSRLTAMFLGFAAIATHLFASIQFAIVFTALGLGVLVRDRRWSDEARRLTMTVAAIALVSVPVLLLRATQAYGPQNEIHTEPQGLMLMGQGLRVVSIGVLWTWMGTLWLLFPLSWHLLWREGRARAETLYLLTTSLAVGLVIFNPLAVGLLEPRLGYLLMRFVWILPVSGLITWLLVWLIKDLRSGRRRILSSTLFGATVLICAPALVDSAMALLRPVELRRAEWAASPLRWEDGLAWLEDSLATDAVILADPATSYSVPMMTRHHVVTLVDQHSSPNDPHALRRILDARDALDPYGDWRRTREVIDRYQVTHVVLNGRFPDPPRFDYWTPSEAWYRAARARIDGAPDAFRRLWDRDDFVVYRVRRGGLDSLAGGSPRPFVRQFDPKTMPIARRMGDGLPLLQMLRFSPRAVLPGDTVRALIDWRAEEPQRPGSYTAYIRFDRELPGAFEPPAVIRKPARKLIERARGELYRFRIDRTPTAGQYGLDLWAPGEVVRDSFAFVVPRGVAPGVYAVGVRLRREPHYPNHHLRDYFMDDDYYSGVPSGVFVVLDRRHRPLPGLERLERGH